MEWACCFIICGTSIANKNIRYIINMILESTKYTCQIKFGDPIKVKLVTVVKHDLEAPFSIATTPRCTEGCYSFPRIDPLYPWSIPYNVECKQGGIKYHILSLWYEPRSPGPLANTLTIMPNLVSGYEGFGHFYHQSWFWKS